MEYNRAMSGGTPVYDEEEDEIRYPEWGDKTEYLLNNLTAGVGFNLKMGASALKIDYAYMNKGLLSHTHRLGLTIAW